jgi:hypothetical protein
MTAVDETLQINTETGPYVRHLFCVLDRYGWIRNLQEKLSKTVNVDSNSWLVGSDCKCRGGFATLQGLTVEGNSVFGKWVLSRGKILSWNQIEIIRNPMVHPCTAIISV